ncbi:MAG: hypothetical protein K2X32_13455 [Phycisphaerales bacterium]|nr:hypothetical protein [Phycisphaerales bacterium]
MKSSVQAPAIMPDFFAAAPQKGGRFVAPATRFNAVTGQFEVVTAAATPTTQPQSLSQFVADGNQLASSQGATAAAKDAQGNAVPASTPATSPIANAEEK